MPPIDISIENSISLVLEALESNPRMKLTEVSRQFNVPYHRLRACQKGRNPSHKHGGHNKKLAEPQDNAVKAYLLLLYGIGIPGTVDILILASNRVLFYIRSEETVSR